MGKMVKGPWPDLTYSIDEVRNFTQDHWSEIAQMRKFLVYIRRLFMKSETIWSDQSESIIELLKKIRQRIQAFSEFLEASERLPYVVCPLRYPLVMGLHQIDEQLKELWLLIAALSSSSSWTPSQQTLILLEEIQQHLEMIFQSWKEAQRNVKVFLDQTESIEEPI